MPLNHVEDYRISQYRQQEIDILRKAIREWSLSVQIPEWIKKVLKDADLIRNEIVKIEKGLVK